MGGGHMAHELGITKPTIRNDHRRCQRHAASAERRHTSVQHELEPVQFVAARRPRAWGGRPTNGKVDGDDQFALAQDDHEEEPVNAREDPMFLPTPPGADESQLLSILFEHGIITHPGPLPAAPRGRTCTSGVAPQRHQHLQAQASKPLDPGALGERVEQTRREVLIPAPHAAQFRVCATPEQRGTHHTNNLAQ